MSELGVPDTRVTFALSGSLSGANTLTGTITHNMQGTQSADQQSWNEQTHTAVMLVFPI